MAERFRDLVRPTLVDVAARSTDSGGARAAENLASAFRGFSRVGSDVGAALSQRIGQQEGAQAGSDGDPEFRTGFRALTAYGRAYNDSALRSYAIRSELDMEEQALRLETEAGTDPESFQEAMIAMRDNILQEAPDEAKQIIGQIYDQRMSAGVGRINGKLAVELQQEDVQLIQEQLAQSTEKIAVLRSVDDPASNLMADEEEVKMFALVEAAVTDGTLSESQGRMVARRVERGIVVESVVAQFDRELEDPNGSPVEFIQNLKEVNQLTRSLLPEEEDQLENTLLAELRERNALRRAQFAGMADAEAERYEAGEKRATADLLAGQLSQRELYEMVQNDELEPSIARTLLNELQSGGAAKSDAATLAHYRINLLGYTEEDILTEPGLTFDDRADLILRRRNEDAGWRGTQNAKEAAARIDREIGIVPGTPVKMLSEDELRLRDRALTQWFDAVDALEPELREAQAIPLAQAAISSISQDKNRSELEDERQRLRLLQRRLADGDYESDNGKRVIERDIASAENNIARLESVLSNRGE